MEQVNMNDFLVMALGIFFVSMVVGVIFMKTSEKSLKYRDEYRIGLSGGAIFMFISWAIVYIANINPFVSPEFKGEPPAYFNRQV